MDPILCTHRQLRTLGCLSFFAVKNSAALNAGGVRFCADGVPFSGVFSEEGVAALCGNSSCHCWRSCRSCCPIHSPPAGHEGSFLPPWHTCHPLPFAGTAGVGWGAGPPAEGTSLPCRLTMLSIFSGVLAATGLSLEKCLFRSFAPL